MKTAIVTGASGNLGQAVIDKFIKQGYNVIGTVLSTDTGETDYPKDRFETVAVDLTSEDDAQQFVDSVIGKHGNIDIAVLTVGGFAKGKIAETKTSDIHRQYKLNFETAYNIARPVFVQMILQGTGRIFIVGSKPGLDAKNSKGMIAYGLTKSLLFRLADLMNEEAKGTDVVTSVLVPSTIDTPQNRASMPDGKFANWVKPEQIADVIWFYSDSTSSIIREPVIKVYNKG
jgi:NAD(P)-dependent dehydrogenase (short-subunit alcohol dehydrogenase family)